ncbi:HK97 family phage prohead protease [Gluconacetobacter diazotrophicus]|uniref:HK97 family phage prohead protease n=1 Tax=Gluconacetobacter diazotrophicus TaxID=33996 RepID=UPI001199872F|nr:HK97 family phage prohead protease [Gluconacetobacter diazotrophicus]TWA98249.1 HK97 family phage prohead protease [Gluconacetobacter diazotrophicus]
MAREYISLKNYSEIKKSEGTTDTRFKSSPVVTNDFSSEIGDITENTATFIITTPTVDRAGDVVIPSGIDITNYKKNPVVLWMHDDSQLPIGKCIDITPSRDGIVATVQFIDFSTKIVGEKAQGIFQLIKQGVLSAVSIGFNVDECFFNEYGGLTITESELVEFSIVNIPCNAQALIVGHSGESKTLTTTSTPVVAQDYSDEEEDIVDLPTAIDNEDEEKRKNKNIQIAEAYSRKSRSFNLSF